MFAWVIKKKIKEAIDSYDKALECSNSEWIVWLNRGDCLAILEEAKEAIDSYDKALEFNSGEWTIWFNKSICLAIIEDFQEAINSCDKALKYNPDSYKCQANRVAFLGKLNRHSEAIKSCDEALRVAKDEPFLWNAKALELSYIKKHSEAIKSIDRAIEISRHNSPKRYKSLYLANKGIILAREGSNIDKAIALCQQAIALETNEHGYYGLACCYALKGDVDLALESLEKAIDYSSGLCRMEAKYNPDFECLHHLRRFQTLTNIIPL